MSLKKNVAQNMVGSTHHILSYNHLGLIGLIHIWPLMYVRCSIMYDKDEFLILIQFFTLMVFLKEYFESIDFEKVNR